MPTFLIERQIPGASKLTDDELRGITTKSNDTVESLNRPYTWRHSYVAGDKIYCIHDAERAGGRAGARARRRVPREPGRRGQRGVRQHRPPRAPRLTHHAHGRPPARRPSPAPARSA